MGTNTKNRSDAFQQAARALLEEHGIDVNEQVHLRPLAQELAARVGCHYDTAKRHIAKAVRLMRGELSHARWGGFRPGAGRPKDEDEQ